MISLPYDQQIWDPPYDQPTMWPAYHVISPPNDQPTMWSLISPPYYQPTIWSAYHVINPPYNQPIIWSAYHVSGLPCERPTMWSAHPMIGLPMISPPYDLHTIWSAYHVISINGTSWSHTFLDVQVNEIIRQWLPILSVTFNLQGEPYDQQISIFQYFDHPICGFNQLGK